MSGEVADCGAAGFTVDTDVFGSIAQGVDVIAVGLVGGQVVLAVLNRVQLGDPLAGVVGREAIAAPAAAGAARRPPPRIRSGSGPSVAGGRSVAGSIQKRP